MKEIELYNINFLLTNQNEQRKNQLLDSFINIYAITLHALGAVSCLNISPSHHFMQEFKDFIDNYAEIEKYLSLRDKNGILLVKGIRAINVLYNKEVPIYINPFLDYFDENVASFGMMEATIPPIDEPAIYSKLNNMELEIVDYGMIKGAEKIRVLVPKKNMKKTYILD
jgi:hypothetical protein